jgi:hypothetical protein
VGLIIEVLRGRHDCTRNGLSSKHDHLTVVNIPGPFNPAPDRPAVSLDSHVKECLRLVPVEFVGDKWQVVEGNWHMAGGNFGHSSDSRFNEACRQMLGVECFYGAVAIHDRVE